MELNQFSTYQKAVLKQFREVIKDCKLLDSDDTYIARWLIARDFDLIKTEKMLRTSLNWRNQYGIDTLLTSFQPPEVLTKYFAANYVGRDKFLNPLWVVRYGMTDVKGILHSVKKKDYLMYVVSLVEEMISKVMKEPAKYKRTPDTIVQATIIFDMDQFSMRHITYKPAMDTAIQLVKVYEANYPELLRRVFVINAPKVFSLAFSLIKPFLHERTRNKISIFSHDPKQWKETILEDVNASELFACYGGTKTDPDGNPNCITMVNMGGEVPKSYYFCGKPSTINKKCLTVPSGSKETLEFPVEKAGVILKWDFHSEDSDIAFAVYRKRGNELIPIVPRDRVDCHLSIEEGEIRCDELGVYVVEFDNSFSFLRSKKIWYSITIESVSPDGLESIPALESF